MKRVRDGREYAGMQVVARDVHFHVSTQEASFI
jgi:hypothetical protein